MSKTYYSDYVKHALRFYTRNLDAKSFRTDIDKDNWYSCHNVVKTYSDMEQTIIFSVYSGYDTIGDEVYNASKEYNIRQNIIWDLMKDIEHKIAKKRKLI